MSTPKILALVATFAALGLPPARAITLVIDYSYDGGYFAANSAARTALEKAASDLSAAILPTLSAVSSSAFTGTFGSPPPSEVTFEWSYAFENPSNPAVDITIPSIVQAADHFTIYAGARDLAGSTLGEGGPVGFDLSISSLSVPEELAGAVAAAQVASNAALRRGAGPVTTTLTGDFSGVGYSLQVGALAGVMSFDTNANWHFDLNTLPAAGTSDFYSVALHEMVHALGFGASTTWESLRAGTNWTGSNVGALTSGINLVTANGHIAEGAMSFTLSGQPQEVLMDPTLTQGTRKTLTQLDLAFLEDLGYNVVPEPAPVALLGLGLLALWFRRRR